MTAALVTGGNGFLGSHLVRELARRGLQVRVLAQPGTDSRRIDDLVRGGQVELLEGDLLEPRSLRRGCAGQELVFHLAGAVQDWGPRELFRRVNLEGTRNLLDAAVDAGARRLVFTSSLAVHRYVGIAAGDETWPRDNAAHPYGGSKIACEDLLLQAHAAGRIEAVVARPGVLPFGPGDRLVLPALVASRARYRHVNGGRARLCTAYAPNLAEGLALCGTVSRAAGRTYVLADEETPTWRGLLDRLFGALGLEPPRRSVPLWLALAAAAAAEAGARLSGRPPLVNRYRVSLAGRDCVFVSDRARAELGWRPRVGLDSAVACTADWLRVRRRP